MDFRAEAVLRMSFWSKKLEYLSIMVLAWDPLPVACQGRGVCELTCLLAR